MRRGTGTTAARRLLERRVREVLRHRNAVLRRARPEDVHDLRVATRRLQEAIDLMAFALPGRERARARRRARRIRRGLATVRDADVLVETLVALATRSATDDRRALLALRPALVARARRARAGVRAAGGNGPAPASGTSAGAASVPVRTKATIRNAPAAPPAARPTKEATPAAAGLPVPGVRRRLRALVRSLPSLPSVSLRRVAARRLGLRSSEVRGALARAGTGRAADLHRLRVAVKKYRYTLELMDEAGLASHARGIAAARRLQEALGLVHDVDVLLAVLRGRRAGPRHPIPAALRRERRRLAAAAIADVADFQPVAGGAPS
jgi:CHAD domain-containing protein